MKILMVYGALVKLGWGRSISIAEGFKDNGHDVDYMEFPQFGWEGLLRTHPYSNLGLPFNRYPFLKVLHEGLQNRMFRKHLKNTYDLIYIYSPLPEYLLRRIRDDSPQAKIIYDIPDDRIAYHQEHSGHDTAMRVRSEEQVTVKYSDYVVAINEYHLHRVKRVTQGQGLVIPNGIDLKNYHLTKRRSNKKCIYVGGINSRIDFEKLIDVLVCNDLTIDMYGPVSIDISTIQSGLINFCGEVSASEIPSLLEEYEYGFLPYNDNDFNKGSQPLKVLQYMAASLVVIDFTGIGNQYELKGVYVLNESHLIPSQTENCQLERLKQYDWKTLTERIIKKVNQGV